VDGKRLFVSTTVGRFEDFNAVMIKTPRFRFAILYEQTIKLGIVRRN